MRVYLEDHVNFGLEVMVSFAAEDDQIMLKWKKANIDIFSDVPVNLQNRQQEIFDRADILYRNPVSYDWNINPELCFVGCSEQSKRDNELWDKLLRKIQEEEISVKIEESIFSGDKEITV